MREGERNLGQVSDKEGWTISASVAIMIACGHFRDRLLLVQRRNGQWGAPAGHMKGKELLIESVLREFQEESGLDNKGIDLLSERPFVIGIPVEDKTKIGVIFNAEYSGRHLDPDGWPVDDPDGDIVFVKPFSKKELMDLIDHPERINRPEFNQSLMVEFLLRFSQLSVLMKPYDIFFDHPHVLNKPRYLTDWLKEKCLRDEIPGLSLKKSLSIRDFYYFEYKPYFEVRISQEAG